MPVESIHAGSSTTPGLQYANQRADCASRTNLKAPEADREVFFREPRLTSSFPCCRVTLYAAMLLQSCLQQWGIIVSQPGRRRGLHLRRVAWQAQQLQHIHGCGWAAPGWRQLRMPACSGQRSVIWTWMRKHPHNQPSGGHAVAAGFSMHGWHACDVDSAAACSSVHHATPPVGVRCGCRIWRSGVSSLGASLVVCEHFK